jgi:Zn-finger nucleic acid-binding protein
MEPVFLGGVELDRCYHDEQLWFDRGEIGRVVDRAREQAPALGVFATLLRRLFGP